MIIFYPITYSWIRCYWFIVEIVLIWGKRSPESTWQGELGAQRRRVSWVSEQIFAYFVSFNPYNLTQCHRTSLKARKSSMIVWQSEIYLRNFQRTSPPWINEMSWSFAWFMAVSRMCECCVKFKFSLHIQMSMSRIIWLVVDVSSAGTFSWWFYDFLDFWTSGGIKQTRAAKKRKNVTINLVE